MRTDHRRVGPLQPVRRPALVCFQSCFVGFAFRKGVTCLTAEQMEKTMSAPPDGRRAKYGNISLPI